MPAKHRKPGPQAIIHRTHRRLVALRIAAFFSASVPQYQNGPRYGQQLAQIRRARGIAP